MLCAYKYSTFQRLSSTKMQKNVEKRAFSICFVGFVQK
jgi:hypothetical protein